MFAVTMNSKANALLALMIATNFVELKGQVYKRTDTNKLWTLACQVGWWLLQMFSWGFSVGYFAGGLMRYNHHVFTTKALLQGLA